MTLYIDITKAYVNQIPPSLRVFPFVYLHASDALDVVQMLMPLHATLICIQNESHYAAG